MLGGLTTDYLQLAISSVLKIDIIVHIVCDSEGLNRLKIWARPAPAARRRSRHMYVFDQSLCQDCAGARGAVNAHGTR